MTGTPTTPTTPTTPGTPGRGPGERAVWSRVSLTSGAGPLRLLTARFDRHRYAPHTHEEFSIGVIFEGVETIDYRRGRVVSGPGSIVVLEPGEPHTGASARPGAVYAYRAFYPEAALLAEGAAPGSRPYFRDGVVYDPELAAALHRVHRAAVRAPDPLRAESELPWLLAALVRRHAAPGSARPCRPVPGADRIARAVRERLGDQPRRPPSLAEVGAELGLSRYQVLRAFRASVGMPPYAWLAQHRVDRARALLEAGHRPAEAAGLVGFADQAHLTRWFRRVLGVTPGAYRASVRNGVQDNAR
ncbi:AraC family transcriptional regulator [Streptomyces sp. 6N223]|uniref:AraC family transcriptional regulator n=1 Tax=Streptomyces sp. 6N223 TaxID=3457412 RepID=UPI003FD26F21